MIVKSTAPMRIGLMGGGTDVGEYAEKYGGLCLNMAINLRQTFFLSDVINDGPKMDIPRGSNPEFYENILTSLNARNLTLKQISDNELESGLGSSAAAVVAIVGGIAKMRGLKVSLQDIAEKAWNIEVNKLGLFGGCQDQYASAFGGLNVFEFGPKQIKVTQLNLNFISWLQPSLLLFHMGIKRESPTIQEGLRKINSKQKGKLDKIKALTIETLEIISKHNLKRFGEVLNQSWELKKDSNKGINNKLIDEIIFKGKELGAYGGKILGAGGGGCILFCVPLEIKQHFIQNIGLRYIDYSIDVQGLDTRIL